MMLRVVFFLFLIVGCKSSGSHVLVEHAPTNLSKTKYCSERIKGNRFFLVHGFGGGTPLINEKDKEKTLDKFRKQNRRFSILHLVAQNKLHHLSNMDELIEYLQFCGAKQIGLAKYRFLDAPDIVLGQIKKDLDSFQNGSEEEFIMVGHSLGHFFSLLTILEFDLSKQIKVLIGLAGVAHGFNNSPITDRKSFKNRQSYKILNEVLATLPKSQDPASQELIQGSIDLLFPTMNENVTGTTSKLKNINIEKGNRKNVIKNLSKCSAYGDEDAILSAPFDSGRFDLGIYGSNRQKNLFFSVDPVHNDQAGAIFKDAFPIANSIKSLLSVDKNLSILNQNTRVVKIFDRKPYSIWESSAEKIDFHYYVKSSPQNLKLIFDSCISPPVSLPENNAKRI